MTIILTGFMGTGKSTIGRLLAARLGLPFIDTDEEVERAAGQTVAAIFENEGEVRFRALERCAVAAAVEQDAVVATGGGAIIDPESYERMHAAGPIICLTAPVETILERTAAHRDRPLLCADDVAARVRHLLAERAAAYARADLSIDTSVRPPETVVEEIVAFLGRRGYGSGRAR